MGPTKQRRSFSLSQERPGISALRLQVRSCRVDAEKKSEAGNTSQNASNCEFGGLKQKLIVLVRERRMFLSLILVLLHLTEVADTWMLLRQPSSFLETILDWSYLGNSQILQPFKKGLVQQIFSI